MYEQGSSNLEPPGMQNGPWCRPVKPCQEASLSASPCTTFRRPRVPFLQLPTRVDFSATGSSSSATYTAQHSQRSVTRQVLLATIHSSSSHSSCRSAFACLRVFCDRKSISIFQIPLPPRIFAHSGHPLRLASQAVAKVLGFALWHGPTAVLEPRAHNASCRSERSAEASTSAIPRVIRNS